MPTIRTPAWLPQVRHGVHRGAVILLVGIGLVAAGCHDAPTESLQMVDSGSWYITGFRWAHDGNPVESANFIVYSDAASEQARRALSGIAEDALAGLMDQLDLDQAMFRFPAGQQKIDIYTYKDYFPQEWGGRAYYGGLMIYSLDHPERTEAGHTALDRYVPVVQHEVMHVAESLLKASGDPTLVDVWLTEGIAEVVSGGNASGRITDRARFQELVARHGALNPVALHRYTDYPDDLGLVYDYYIPMFQLAAQYLFDPDGLGAPLANLRELYLDIRRGVGFAQAFVTRLGIGLAEYESRFFELMDTYLE